MDYELNTEQTTTSQTNPGGDQSACRFLTLLPYELRVHIYNYVLVAQDTVVDWPSYDNVKGITAGLLATCRRIHNETAPILYARNVFLFLHASDCIVFRHVMSRHSSAMTNVRFRFKERDIRLWVAYFNSHHSSRSLTRDLPHLAIMDIELQQPAWGPGVDLDEFAKDSQYWYMNNKALRTICNSLSGNVPDEVFITITICVRIADTQLQYLWRHHYWMFCFYNRPFPPTHVRTKAEKIIMPSQKAQRANGFMLVLELKSTRHSG